MTIQATETARVVTTRIRLTVTGAPRFKWVGDKEWQPASVEIAYSTRYEEGAAPRHETPLWEGTARLVRANGTLGDTTRNFSRLYGCPPEIVNLFNELVAERDPRR